MNLYSRKSFEKQREYVLSDIPEQCQQRTVAAGDGVMRCREFVDGRGVCWRFEYRTPDDFSKMGLCGWTVCDPSDDTAVGLGHDSDELTRWQRAFLHSRLDHPEDFQLISKSDPRMEEGQLVVDVRYEDDRGVHWRLSFASDPAEFDANGLPKDFAHLLDWEIIDAPCQVL